MKVTWPAGEAQASACPVCDAPGPHPVLLRAEGHTLVRCGRCSGCFFVDRTMPDYAADQPSELFVQFYAEQNAGLHHMSRFLYKIADPPGDAIDSVLDVGCGFGFPVDVAARELGWRAVGLDPSHYAEAGRRLLGADIRREYLTADTDVGAPYHLVLGVEVIEHIPDLYPFMEILRRHLRPGGTLVLTTPDAGSLSPAVNEGMLVAMLSVGAHLVLFSARSMEVMLRRAGFAHVHCECAGYNLVAYASDQPLRFRPDAEAAHFHGYRAYLQRVLDTAEPGSTLWNGAAGRLFALDVGGSTLEELFTLWARIVASWRERFGIDLHRLRLPPLLAEEEFRVVGPALIERLRAEAPLNLAGVLYNRALLERRVPGAAPEDVLRFARAGHRVAVQTCRALQEFGLIDYDLNLTSWRARIVCVDCLIEMAPEFEGSLLAGLGVPSPGALAQRTDPPPEVLAVRMAPFFARMVHATQYEEALRLEPWLRDLDLVCLALGPTPLELFHALFCIGVLRLNAMNDPHGALAAFQRMLAEAETGLHEPARADLARHFLPVAQEHVALARSRVPAPAPAPTPAITPPAPKRKRKAA